MVYVKKSTCRMIFIVSLLLLCFYLPLHAQRVAVKTNTIGWLTASTNIETEFILGRHFSLNASIAGNPVHTDKLRTTFFHVQPEIRYWLNRPLVSHFFGVTAFSNSYNILIDDVHRKGDAFAGGITYGYDWVLNKHWNIEATLGVGVLRYRQFKYDKGTAKPAAPNDCRTIFAPIKLGISIAYVFH